MHLYNFLIFRGVPADVGLGASPGRLTPSRTAPASSRTWFPTHAYDQIRASSSSRQLCRNEIQETLPFKPNEFKAVRLPDKAWSSPVSCATVTCWCRGLKSFCRSDHKRLPVRHRHSDRGYPPLSTKKLSRQNGGCNCPANVDHAIRRSPAGTVAARPAASVTRGGLTRLAWGV